MQTTLTLELKFNTAEKKTRNLNVRNPKLNLTAAEIQPAMEAIVALDAFEVDGVNPYAGVESARYVERIVTDVLTPAE